MAEPPSAVQRNPPIPKKLKERKALRKREIIVIRLRKTGVMTMDTRQLRTLVAINTHGSFAQAANTVGLTASAVSQQVLALEDELQVVLFDRSCRPPKLTPQGIQVLEMARDILQREDDAKASMRGDLVAGTLMLGSVRSSALNLLPTAIAKLRSKHAQLKINLRVSLSAPLIADVATRRLDAAIVAEHANFPRVLKWSPFLQEPLWLIGPKGTKSGSVLELIKSEPYVRFQSPVPLANLIDTELARLGVATNDVAHIDTVASIVTCVRQGLGISVVPHVALQEPEDDKLLRVPFGSPQIARKIGIVERVGTPRGELVQQMHSVLVDLCGKHGIPLD